MKCYRMLSAVCVLLAICSALSLPVGNQDLDSEFEEWKKTHEKVYSGPEEEAKRRETWEETKKRVEAHNKEADQGLHTYWMGMNQFSDQTKEERQKGCLLPPAKDLDLEMEPGVGNFTNVALDGDVGKNSSMVLNVGEIENQ